MTTKFKSTDTPLYKQNKQWGDYFEMESIHIIEEKFNKVLNRSGKYLKFICDNTATTVHELKGWDTKYGIYTNDHQLIKTVTFEIKCDKFPSRNVFFERSCSKKPSGVYATNADYFVYLMPRHTTDNFFISKSPDLLGLLNLNRYHLTYGGEGNRVTGWITDREDFIDDFKEVGGKVYTWNVNIPEEFDAPKFD